MWNICVVTSTRADYGILSGLLKKIDADSELTLKLVVTGMHLMPEFGETYKEIENDGLKIAEKIDIAEKGDTELSVAKVMSNATRKFAEYFAKNRPDILIILGDRTEMLGVASAALIMNIPIAHIHGGELTFGAVDDAVRHSLTKMSRIHFTACEEYRKRVIQMGERPDTVFDVGAMGVENALKMEKFTKAEVRERLHLDNDKPYVMVTFHPETQSILGAMLQVQPLLKTMKAHPEYNYVITKANSDAGGLSINELWEKECKIEKNWNLYASLGAKLYLSAVRDAQFVIGNSSSAILEVPSFKIPSVDIGDRQKGRIMAESVIHADNNEEAVSAAFEEAVKARCEDRFKDMKSPFGEGDTADRILEHLKDALRFNKIGGKKEFYDLYRE
ncbi:MAG: UDP-N-acetylglucosamine 2-epimerase (hydrolyzing) [Lachnospiraceae bacterium]|nr:UDP-N-acetylglucosamine 2-epimerase (hydrolyzing) [Lachnospiraceae bacterium]MBR5789807.1 UDP-N-acetylglucosamine 2-epimerase (hydrolyzing) [Lachnospiraceae bacterium]